jgi:hypothetical protein
MRTHPPTPSLEKRGGEDESINNNYSLIPLLFSREGDRG